MIEFSEHERDFMVKLICDHTKIRTKVLTHLPPEPGDERYHAAMQTFWDSMKGSDGYMHFGKVKMIDANWNTGGWVLLYTQMFLIHQLLGDDYSIKNVSMIEDLEIEGPHIFGDEVNISPGETVIDAGAYFGEFAALASVMGAKAYAFEPSPRYAEQLKLTSKLNNFTPVFMGVGNKTSVERFNTNAIVMTDSFNKDGDVDIQMVTLDDFRKQMGLKIDFLKADIEGFERNMLMGAMKTLQEDKPKLSIVTNHLPDDKPVLEAIIRAINPDYKVIQRPKVLYAYVP